MLPYINVFGIFIGSYGVLMVLGFSLAVILSYRRAIRYCLVIEDILIVAAFAALLGLLCGAILYALVTYPVRELLNSLIRGDFRVFGGIVYYGGFIGGVIGALIGTRVAKIPFSAIESAVVPHIPLGHAIGRIGCVLAGCCNGMPYSGPFAVYYPNSVAGLDPAQGYFPIQLLEALLNIGIFVLLLQIDKKRRCPFDLLASYCILYGISRFILEFLRGDAIRGIAGGLSTSQWISIVLLGISLLYFVLRRMIYSHIDSGKEVE